MNNLPVSVVIPCYNHGQYLEDVLKSLDQCDTNLFEVIIVNDGSTDEYTNQYLLDLSRKGYNVISQKNLGLGAARNEGIKKAKGKYILPLDADNRIHPDYITKSLEVFEKYDDIAVVYSNANYFGEKTGILRPGPFNLQRLMLGNYIDACAVIRKTVIEEVGFYDNMRIMGYEDWDLWLRIGFKDYKFYYIDEALFDYRVTNNSMMRSLNADIKRQNEIEQYFIDKYKDKLSYNDILDHLIYKAKKRPFNFFYKLLLQKVFPSHYNKLIRENKIYRGFYYDRG